jgi:hypothetical protein
MILSLKTYFAKSRKWLVSCLKLRHFLHHAVRFSPGTNLVHTDSMFPKKSLLLLSASIFFGALIGFMVLNTTSHDISEPIGPTDTEITSNIVDLPIIPVEEEFPHVIPAKSSLFLVLRELEVDPATIHAIVESSKPVYNLARLHHSLST